MSKIKRLLMQMYDRYESLEGECDKLKHHYLKIEQQYYESSKQENRN